MANEPDTGLEAWWQNAKGLVTRKENRFAWELGFDSCQSCGEWFYHGPEDWVDCAGCGRRCPACAEDVDWVGCEVCGFSYCQACIKEADRLACPVCTIGV